MRSWGTEGKLPPTTFFQRAALDAETEVDEQTRTVVEEGESILDVASTLYEPVRRLRVALSFEASQPDSIFE